MSPRAADWFEDRHRSRGAVAWVVACVLAVAVAAVVWWTR